MLTVNLKQVVSALQEVGITPGDGLLVHSALQFLGRPEGGVAMYLAALQQMLGPGGTLAAPAFSFSFARGEPFDRGNTPSRGMGVFSEYVRLQQGAQRTSHPLQSLALLGRHALELARRDTAGAFDPGSAFERLLELDFKLLLLGADIQAASMVHYSEQRAAVPYRYWKEFHGLWRDGDLAEGRTYRMYARDLDLDPTLVLQPIQAGLEAQGLWRQGSLGYGRVCACRLQDFVAVTDALLAANPWVLVKK
jgi:aminoglycoside 3-N-acetyltransferase